jgi:hypothetical protein
MEFKIRIIGGEGRSNLFDLAIIGYFSMYAGAPLEVPGSGVVARSPRYHNDVDVLPKQ